MSKQNKIKQVLLAGVKISITVLLLGYIISKINFNDFFYLIKQVNLAWYLPFFFSMGVIILLASLKLNLLLKVQGIKVNYKEAFKLTYTGYFFSNFMLGSLGGDFIKMFYVSGKTDCKTKAISSVIFDRLVGFFAILMFCLIGLIINWNNEKMAAFKITFIILIAGILAAILGYNLLLRFSRKLSGNLQRVVSDIHDTLKTYNCNKPILLKAFVVAVVIQAIVIAINITFGIALGIKDIPFYYYIVIIPIISLFTALPISIGGWGVSEAGYGYFFGLVGMPLTQAVVLSLIFRLSFMLWTLPGGLVFLRLKLQKPINNSVSA